MHPGIVRHLALQAGVISRQQALAEGLQPHDVRRLLRRREWAIVLPGVYVSHTGTPTWLQRAWAGVLSVWPAALCHESALRAADGPGARDRVSEDIVHVGIDRRRSSLVVPAGLRIHHVNRLEEKVLWNLGPPRMRYDEAALDVAAEADSEFMAIAALAKACQSRRTTADRLLALLDERSRVRRRTWLRNALRDVADGTCSVLEHGYLDRVERPHHLPAAVRQARDTASVGVVYRDTEYAGSCVIELDGRLFHDSTAQRDADFERDLDAAVAGKTTTRLSWGQVFDRPCTTAAKVGQILRTHGIPCRPRGCGPGCSVGHPIAAVPRIGATR